MTSKKHKKVCMNLHYIEDLLIWGIFWISAFPSLVCILIWISSSSVRLKICEITAGIKKYKSVIKKKKLDAI